MLTGFIIASTIMSCLMAIIWGSGDLVNIIIKITHVSLAFLGGYIVLTNNLLGTISVW